MNDFTDLSGQTQLVFKDTTTRATYDEKGTPVFCAKDRCSHCARLCRHCERYQAALPWGGVSPPHR